MTGLLFVAMLGDFGKQRVVECFGYMISEDRVAVRAFEDKRPRIINTQNGIRTFCNGAIESDDVFVEATELVSVGRHWMLKAFASRTPVAGSLQQFHTLALFSEIREFLMFHTETTVLHARNIVNYIRRVNISSCCRKKI